MRLGPRVHVAPAYTGTAVWYHDNKKKHIVRTFKNGVLEGPMTSWYDDGHSMQYTVNFKANKKDGVARGFFCDGTKKFEINYSMGLRNDLEIWWYNNGAKRYEFQWENGELQSAKAWDVSGTSVPPPNKPPQFPDKINPNP